MRQYITIRELTNLLNDIGVNNIKIINTEDKSPFFGYVVICDGTNDRFIYAMAEKVAKYCKENNIHAKTPEGKNSRWIMVDFGDIVLHIFHEDERSLYNLEVLWSNNEVVTIRE